MWYENLSYIIEKAQHHPENPYCDFTRRIIEREKKNSQYTTLEPYFDKLMEYICLATRGGDKDMNGANVDIRMAAEINLLLKNKPNGYIEYLERLSTEVSKFLNDFYMSNTHQTKKIQDLENLMDRTRDPNITLTLKYLK